MQRRSFLHGTAAAATLASTTRLWAAPARTRDSSAPPDTRFLLVFLRGGYDAMSLLVPRQSSFYAEVRPNIAIPQAAAGSTGRAGATPLDADWSLHPALSASLLPLVGAGQLRFIPFAGTDDVSRSHFETQDSIELGQATNSGGQRDFRSGFLNRLAGVLGGRQAIAFTDQLPLVMRGNVEVANISLKAVPKSGNDAALRSALAGMYRHHALENQVNEGFEVRDEVARDMAAPAAPSASPPMAGEMVAANRNAVSTQGFEAEARRIARLMRERYALGFVDIGGWDTHVGQGAATGYLANRFEELGRGLAGFADEIGSAEWRKTVVVVVSEFGRTARENGNRGTDHGHGSVYWVLGGGLAGAADGRPVIGEQVPVAASSLFQNRDLPVLNDYRAVLGGLFARQFALDRRALELIFPGSRPRDLGLV
jgi:uncharacterized protein (DUF1501 family)